jgi:lysophospholipase L1-like esterase
MRFENGQKILFIGDSITDCGRRELAAPYGSGYMSLVRAMVLARYPEMSLRFENRGIGGNTVRHLAERWDADVIAEQPDWLSVMIGINDVWRTFDRGGDGAVGIEEYESTYRGLLADAVARTSCRLIVAEPYVIEVDRTDPMRAQMDAYGKVARALATEFDALLVQTQSAFDRALESAPAEAWANDRIHPNLEGHGVIAIEYLRAIGWEL